MLKQSYPVTFSPLPTTSSNTVFFDEAAVCLPCTDDFQTLHYHDRYEIGLCEEGEGVFLFEDGVSCISKGDVVFITPYKRHYSRSLSKDNPCLCSFVYVDVKSMEGLMSFVCHDNAEHILENADKYILPIICPSNNPKEAETLRKLVESCKSCNKELTALTSLRLALFILETYNSFTNLTAPEVPRQNIDSEVSAVAEYLSINYDKNNNIDDLLKICNFSESQLRRRFVKVYGIPPIAYKNRLRCKVAANLLEKTQMSIAEISSYVGYSDISDFYRAFKKNYGCAPTAYRATSQN